MSSTDAQSRPACLDLKQNGACPPMTTTPEALPRAGLSPHSTSASAAQQQQKIKEPVASSKKSTEVKQQNDKKPPDTNCCPSQVQQSSNPAPDPTLHKAPEDTPAKPSSIPKYMGTLLPSPPPTPPVKHQQRGSTPISPSGCRGGTKSSTPDSFAEELLPPPPTPPPQFCQSSSSREGSPSCAGGTGGAAILPPPPLDDDEFLDVFPGKVSPPPPMSPARECNPPSTCNTSTTKSSSLAPTGNTDAVQPGAVDGVFIQSDDVISLSSRSENNADQPLVRDTRCDLLAAIREGLSYSGYFYFQNNTFDKKQLRGHMTKFVLLENFTL